MRDAGHTKQERQFRSVMQTLAFLFLLIAIATATIPDVILTTISQFGVALFDWKTRVPLLGEERFWVVLSSSFLLTLSYLSFMASRDPFRNGSYAKAVFLGNTASAIGFFICFFAIENLFIYLVGGIIDALLALILLVSYRAAHLSRP